MSIKQLKDKIADGHYIVYLNTDKDKRDKLSEICGKMGISYRCKDYRIKKFNSYLYALRVLPSDIK